MTQSQRLADCDDDTLSMLASISTSLGGAPSRSSLHHHHHPPTPTSAASTTAASTLTSTLDCLADFSVPHNRRQKEGKDGGQLVCVDPQGMGCLRHHSKFYACEESRVTQTHLQLR